MKQIEAVILNIETGDIITEVLDDMLDVEIMIESLFHTVDEDQIMETIKRLNETDSAPYAEGELHLSFTITNTEEN